MPLNQKLLTAAAVLWLGTSLPLSADVIGMRTTKAVGETIELAMDNGVEAVLDWGGGTTVELVFTGWPQAVTVQGDSLRITTTGNVTSLYCAGNQLVSLNVKQATKLEKLACNDNSIAYLDLYYNRQLTEVNCQRNNLNYFRVRYCTLLERLNCAQNPLGKLDLGTGLKKLTALVCAETGLTSLSVTSLTALRSLWCQDNALETLDVSANTNLTELYAFGNRLTELDLSTLAGLQELYVDENLLEALDVTNNLSLVTLCADHNRLNTLSSSTKNKAALKHLYVNDNNLAFNSLPTVYSTSGGGKDMLPNYCVAPQNPFEIDPAISVGDQLTLSSWINKNAWSTTVSHTLTWKYAADGTPLTLDTDYSLVKKGVYSFLAPVGDVYAEITAPTYPGLTVRTSVIKVMVDATPVTEVTAQSALRIATEPGALVLKAEVAQRVTVVGVDGRLLWNETLSPGTYRRAVPAGLYVVNGQKVVVRR